MLGSHEDEYIGYGEPYMVPTQRRSNSFQTPETSRHNSLSSPGSGDGPCSSQRVDDSSLLFSRIYDDCSGSSNDSVDVHCLLQHVKSSVPQVSGNFVEELSFALDSGCIGQCVSKAQFLDAVSFSVPDINQNRYGSPRECSQHQQNILQLEHTVRLLRQERDESHQQIQQLEGQYLSLTSQVHRLSSTNSSLSLEAERCRELSAECEYLQSSLAAEQRGRAEAVSSVRELQSRLERQDEHVARLTLSLDRAEGELRDREDLQRQLEAAAQLASCQVGELSAALIKWRSRDDDVRNTVEQLKQALKDAEDSVMRAVEDKQQCEQELVFLRRQSLLSASSPDPRGDRQTAPEAESTGDTVGVCSEPAALEVVCSIRDEIFQSIECDSCSEEVSRTLPLSGISSSAPFHGALLTPPTKGELASTVDTPDCRDRGSGISCGSLSWRDNVCVYSTSDDDSRVDVSDDSVLADTSLISHTLPRSNGLGEIVEHLQQLDVSSAASLIVSDDPTGVQSEEEDVTGGLVDEVVSSCPGSDPAVVDVMTFSSSDRDCSQSYDECCQVVSNHLAERQRLRLLSDSPPLLSPGEYATIPHLSYQVQCALLAGVARAIAVLSSLQISVRGSGWMGRKGEVPTLLFCYN